MRNDRTWETKDLQMSLAFWLPNAARVGGPRWTVDGGQWATGDASQPVSQPASQWPGIYLSQEAGQANYIQNTRPDNDTHSSWDEATRRRQHRRRLSRRPVTSFRGQHRIGSYRIPIQMV